MKKYTLEEIGVAGCNEFRRLIESIETQYNKSFNVWGNQEDIIYAFNIKIVSNTTNQIKISYHTLESNTLNVITVEEFKNNYYDEFIFRIMELSKTNTYSII